MRPFPGAYAQRKNAAAALSAGSCAPRMGHRRVEEASQLGGRARRSARTTLASCRVALAFLPDLRR